MVSLDLAMCGDIYIYICKSMVPCDCLDDGHDCSGVLPVIRPVSVVWYRGDNNNNNNNRKHS